MTAKLSKAELRTTRHLHRLMAELLKLLAGHFGGKTTLNHLRVGNFIGLRSQHQGRPTSNREIAEVLGMSRPTVSRIVSDFIRAGWVTEYAHPEDGRRRLLVITPNHPDDDRFERELRRMLNGLLDLYKAGKIVNVDPDKHSF